MTPVCARLGTDRCSHAKGFITPLYWKQRTNSLALSVLYTLSLLKCQVFLSTTELESFHQGMNRREGRTMKISELKKMDMRWGARRKPEIEKDTLIQRGLWLRVSSKNCKAGWPQFAFFSTGRLRLGPERNENPDQRPCRIPEDHRDAVLCRGLELPAWYLRLTEWCDIARIRLSGGGVFWWYRRCWVDSACLPWSFCSLFRRVKGTRSIGKVKRIFLWPSLIVFGVSILIWSLHAALREK